jgi:hypothetical protein
MLPELWNPMTGDVRPLPQFSEKGGLTQIPLVWERFESYFILFRKETPSRKIEGLNFQDLERVVAIEGPWNVSFDLIGAARIQLSLKSSLTGHSIRIRESNTTRERLYINRLLIYPRECSQKLFLIICKNVLNE